MPPTSVLPPSGVTWNSVPGLVVTSMVPSGRKVIAQGSSNSVTGVAVRVAPSEPVMSKGWAAAGATASMAAMPVAKTVASLRIIAISD